MVTIYFTLIDGYVSGWSSTPSGTDHELHADVENDHEVLRNPEIFKLVDGELFKDEERQQQLIDEYQETLSEIELLRQEIDMNALAFMEFAEMFLGGGSK